MAQKPAKKKSCRLLQLIPELKKESNSIIIKEYTHIKLHMHSRIHQCDYFGNVIPLAEIVILV